MVLKLLEVKDGIKRICEKYWVYVKVLIKLISAFVIFLLIDNNIGYNATLKSMVIVVGLAFVSALTPDAIFVMLAALLSIAHAYSVAPVLAAAIAMIYLIIFFMYVRYIPRQAFIILAIPFLYLLKIPYVIPLLCGIFFSPISIISNVCGILIYYMFEAVNAAASVSDGSSVSNTINFFNRVVDSLKGNKFMMASMVVFAVMILVTYIFRRRKFKHASDIAILLSTLIGIVAFLVLSVLIEGSDGIGVVLVGFVVSGLIAYIARFFRMTLDYAGTKHIQFEDDEYYYYVKAVPKLAVTAPDKQVKRIHAQKPTGNTMNLQDVIEKVYSEDDGNRME